MFQTKLIILILTGLVTVIDFTNANVVLNVQLLQSMNILPTNTSDLTVQMKNISKIDNDTFTLYNKSISLDLSLNIISEIDEKVLRNLPKLKRIDLSFNRLTTLQPNTFNNQKELLIIKLNDNRLTSLPLFNLSTLTLIDLSKNYLTRLHNNVFSSMKNLTSISLSSNRIDQIDSNLFTDLTRLSSLDLSNNMIKSLSSNIFKNQKFLSILNLKDNQLTSLEPKDLSGLSSIYSLDLSSNNLTSIADFTFSNISIMSYLNLSSNKLTALTTKTFAGLNRTRIRIDLRNNKLANISNEILQTYAFGSVYLSNNQLSSTLNMNGIAISGKLGLSNNKLTGVSNVTINIDRLNILLNDNSIESLNAFSCQISENSDVSTLYLNFSNNILKSISINPKKNTDCFSKSALFNLNSNMIERLNISGLSDLYHLDLSFNKLTSLESYSFNNLSKLTSLNLKNNQISKLSPRWVSGHNKIFDLDLSFNRLTYVHPNYFEGFNKLFELYLDSNLIKNIDSNSFSLIQSFNLIQSATFTLSLKNNSLTSINGLNLSNSDNDMIYIYLSYNQIDSIDIKSIIGSEKIIRISIDNNKFTSLNIGDFSIVRFLDISSNPLKSVNISHFGDFLGIEPNLANLSLNTSDAILLFDKLKTRLKAIDLSLNKIDELGSWIGKQRELRILNFSSNQIKRIQQNIFIELSLLNYLILSNNQLTSLNADCFKGLNTLMLLDLSGNKLTTISDYAFRGIQFSDLAFSLKLSNNNLTSLNKNTFSGIVFRNFNEMELDSYTREPTRSLDLSGNRLSKIDPNSFSELAPNLTFINLMKNSLDYLDTSMFLPMLNLSYLALSGNRVFDNQSGNNYLQSLCSSCNYGLAPYDFVDYFLDILTY